AGAVLAAPLPGRLAVGGRSSRRQTGRGRDRRLDVGGQLGREQVGQHHRAGQVGQLVVADPPSVGGPADHRVLGHGGRGTGEGLSRRIRVPGGRGGGARNV